ncbi:MAG: FlgD immunoglobulin-like domain containing protein, partial [Victivallaceae bacterium]
TVWLWLEDNVGNADPLTASSITLRYDTLPPVSSAWVLDPVSFSPIQVTFNSSDKGSGVANTALWWRRDEAGNGYFGDWRIWRDTATGTTGSFRFDPQGVDGNYEFYTQAIDKPGNIEPPPVSTTIAKAKTLFDHTPPMTVFIGDGDYTNKTTELSAYWDIYDPVSGVNDIQAGVGTYPGADNVKAFASVGVKSSATITISPPLPDGKYYISLKARNRAWVWSEAKSGDGIIVDTVPPDPPVIEKPFTGEFVTALMVEGVAEPSSTILVFKGTSICGSGVTGPDGRFRVGFSGLGLGENQISVAAKDSAGNISQPKSLTIVTGVNSANPRINSLMLETSTGNFNYTSGQDYAVVLGQKMYALKSVDSYVGRSELRVYDPIGANLSDPVSYPYFSDGMASADGKLYLISGKSFVAIDPQTGIASQKSHIPTKRELFATISYGGRIYTIGGANFRVDYNALEAYDPETDKWKVLAPMPTPRYRFAAVAVDGRIFALGGGNAGNWTLSTVEEYNSRTNTWSSRPPLKIGRTNHKAVVLNGMIVLFGGNSGVIEIYDPVSGNSRLDVVTPPEFANAPAAVIGDVLFSFTGNAVMKMRFKDVISPVAPIANRMLIVNNPAGQEDTIEGFGGNIQNLTWSVNVSGLETISGSGERQYILEANTFTAPADVSGLAEVNTTASIFSSNLNFQPKPLSVYNVDALLRGLRLLFPTHAIFRLFEDGVIIQTRLVGIQTAPQKRLDLDPSSTWIYKTSGTVLRIESRRDVVENSFNDIIGPQNLLTQWQTDLNREGGTMSGLSATVNDNNPDVVTSITGTAGSMGGVLTTGFPEKTSPAVEPLSKVKIYGDAFLKNLITEIVADVNGGFSKIKIGDNLFSRVFMVAVDKSGNASLPAELTVFDSTAPVITGIEASPAVFSPNNDGLFEQVNINFRLSKAAYVSVKILDESSATVRTLLSGQLSSSGTTTVVWDGRKDDMVTVLPSGFYRAEIQAKDALGNLAVPVYAAVCIDLIPPAAPIISTPADGVILATNTLVIAGTAEPGTVLEVYDGAALIASTMTEGTGLFALTILSRLSEGIHLLSAKTIDAVGNKSLPILMNVNVDLGLAYVGLPVNTYRLPFTRQGYNIAVDTTTQKAIIGPYRMMEWQIAIVNLATNVVERTFQSYGEETKIVVNPITSQVIIASWDLLGNSLTSSKIGIVDLKSNSISAIPINFSPIRLLDINPLTNKALIAYYYDSAITEIDLLTFSTRTVTREPINTMSAMAVIPKTNQAIISGRLGTRIINLTTGDTVVNLGLGACDAITVDANSDSAMASCGNSLYVLNISSVNAAIIKRIPNISGNLLVTHPMLHLVAVSSRGSGLISLVDWKNSDTILARKILPTYPCNGIAINTTNNTLITAEGAFDNTGGWFSIVPLPDMVRPQISSVTLSTDYFSPAQGTVALQYYLSEPAGVTADVVSAKPPYNRVKRITENAVQSAGINVLRWNGKDDNFGVLPEGEYSIRVSARDTAGNLSAPAIKSLYVDMQPPQISAAAARPGVFNPAYNETTRFVFGLSEAARLTIKIADASAVDIKTLVSESTAPAGTLNFSWDGRSNNGALVPPGIYAFKIRAVDSAGNMSETSGGTCEVRESEYPAVTDINETPEIFFPEDADAAKNKVVFSYNLHGTSTMTAIFPVAINIIHPAAGIVKTLNLLQSSGTNTAQWDGISAVESAFAGYMAPDGVYKEEITVNIAGKIAVAQGVFSVVRRNSFSVDSKEPVPAVTVKYDNPQAKISISRDPPVATHVSMAVQSQLAQGNILISPIYDIVSDRSFNTPPMLRFKYNPLYDGDSLMLLKFSEATKAWIPASASYFADIKSQEMVFTLDPQIFLGSLFALFKIHDTTPPEITMAQAIPGTFSPDGDGVNDKTTISYMLSDNVQRPLTINLDIADAGQNIVRQLVMSAIRPPGANHESWDGRDNAGKLLG